MKSDDESSDDEAVLDDESEGEATEADATGSTDDEQGEELDDEEVVTRDGVVVGDDQLAYEFHEWAGESRGLLDNLLSSNQVQHAWQGTTLVIRVEDEDAVDGLIDQVELSAKPALDADADKVVYEVGSWSAAMQNDLAESLAIADIPFEWDYNGDLVIYEEHEERVEEILDLMPDPDDEEIGIDEGVAVQDALSQLFVAADLLSRDVTDASAVIEAAQATEAIEALALPFGFTSAVWRELVAKAIALREDLGSEGDISDEEIEEKAAALRDALRPYV